MGHLANCWPCGRDPGSWGTGIREVGWSLLGSIIYTHIHEHPYTHMQIYIHVCTPHACMHTLEEEEEEERQGGARRLLLGKPIAKKTPNPQRVLDHAL